MILLTPSQIALFEVPLFIVKIYVVISYKVILSTSDIFTLYSFKIFFTFIVLQVFLKFFLSACIVLHTNGVSRIKPDLIL